MLIMWIERIFEWGGFVALVSFAVVIFIMVFKE